MGFARSELRRAAPGYAGLLLLALLALPGPAAAVSGVLEATSYRDLPAAATIAVRRPDGSPLSADVAVLLREELRRRGRATDARASHTLSFRITGDPNVGVARPPDIELQGSVGSSGMDEAVLTLRMQLLDRQRGVAGSRARQLTLELSDQENRLVWQARATASGGNDEFELARATFPWMLEWLGRSAFGERMP